MTAVAPTPSRVSTLVVPASFVALAASGYLALVLGARVLPAAAFAGLSSFYLLANTVGRGTFAALELELTRGVARARGAGESAVHVCRTALVRGAVLLVAVLAALAVSTPLLVRTVGDGYVVALLGVAAVGLALSSFVRGPLAGAGRYSVLAGSLCAEAGVALLGAVALVAGDVHSPHAWAALFAISPFAGVLVATVAVGRRFADALLLRRAGPATVSGTTLSALLWASLLFLASQGVWNLAPVVATGRSAGMLDAAAGYAATFVLLRAPVMVFPAIQALVLPRLVRTPVDAQPRTALRPGARLTVAGVVLAVVWIGVATALIPLVVDWLFTTGEVPPRVMIAVLSVAILLGTLAQFTQAALVAEGRTSAVALVWLAALVVLLGVAALPVDVFWAATSAQLAATTVALVAMLAVLVRGHRS